MWELSPSVLRLVERNNGRVRRLDDEEANPRSTHDLAWYRQIVAAHPLIRGEWDGFAAAGGDLPLIEEVLGVPDQNEGSYWKMTAFVIHGRPVPELAEVFPETVDAILRIPRLRAACWSVLGPGGWIPEHDGENAGCLRFLLAVDASGATMTVDGSPSVCADGEGMLFDDTVPHAAHNPRPTPRVVILCDLLRPLPGLAGLQNRATQRALHSFTPAYRGCAERGTQRFLALNAGMRSGVSSG